MKCIGFKTLFFYLEQIIQENEMNVDPSMHIDRQYQNPSNEEKASGSLAGRTTTRHWTDDLQLQIFKNLPKVCLGIHFIGPVLLWRVYNDKTMSPAMKGIGLSALAATIVASNLLFHHRKSILPFKNLTIDQLVKGNWEHIPQMKAIGLVPAMRFPETFKALMEWIINVADHTSRSALLQKCLQYAVNQKRVSTAFKTCKIVYEQLSKMDHDLDQDCQNFVKEWELRFRDKKKMVLPGYYKQLLGRESPFFHALFNSPFKERNSHTFPIEVEEKHFNRMLDFLTTERIADIHNLHDLIEFIKAADFLQMQSNYSFAKEVLIKVIRHSRVEDHLKMTLALREHPVLENDWDILYALDNYLECYMHEFYKREWGDQLNSDHYNEIIKSLAETCPNLRQVKGYKITNEGLAHLSSLPLKNLILSNCDVTDLTPLANLPLQSLTLRECSQITSCLSHLASLSLQELVIEDCYNIVDSDLAYLATLSLRSLKLKTKLTDKCLVHLSPSLESLELRLHMPITDEGLAYLANLPLKKLYFGKFSGTDKGLVHLSAMPLEELDFGIGSCITDASLAHLSTIKSLQKLHLDSPYITDAGLAHLSTLQNLQTLSLRWSTITDTGLTHLSKLSLKELNLYMCRKITDAGMAHITNLPLQSLNLQDCNITDAGLALLAANLPQLQELNLSGCKITADGLVAYLPDLPIKKLYCGVEPNPYKALLSELIPSLETLFPQHLSAAERLAERISRISDSSKPRRKRKAMTLS